MRAGALQNDCAAREVAQNVKQMHEFVARSADADCELVVFPEMSDTGYFMTTILETASNWTDGPVKQLREAARAYGLHVVAGLSEQADDAVFNTIVSIDQMGDIIENYRKT